MDVVTSASEIHYLPEFVAAELLNESANIRQGSVEFRLIAEGFHGVLAPLGLHVCPGLATRFRGLTC